MNRKSALLGTALLATVLGAGSACADTLGYQLDITTGYGFGNPFGGSTFLGGGTASPDTGFVEITNNGTTTFQGTLSTTANSPGGNFSSSFAGQTLAPGQSVSIAIGPESSNQGGFNGGSPNVGVLIMLNGLVTNGSSNEGVNLSVSDANIHSGVFRVANGTNSDSYVLQGGDPFGGDTGDGFEVTQAQGHFRFFEQAVATPLPAALPLMGTVLGGGYLVSLFRRRRKPAGAAA
jgi:hypothetical protein